MKTKRSLLSNMKLWMMLFVMVFVCQCTMSNELTCNCEERSMDAWTAEFINNMNAGAVPEQADLLALEQSKKVKSNCLQQVTLN